MATSVSGAAPTLTPFSALLPGTHSGLPIDLLDVLPTAAFVCDAAGILRGYNRRAAELWGREPVCGDERYCGSYRTYRPDGTPIRHDEGPLAQVLASGHGVEDLELVVERPDGSQLTALVNVRPLTDPSGTLIGAIESLLDVTALRAGDETRQVLAAIVESSDDAIVSKTLNGVITSWNAGAQRVFGYTPDEVLGKPIEILIPLDRWHEESEILSRIRRGERVEHFETVRKRKDGAPIDISLTISPLRDEAGRIVGASKIARDITQKKEAEQRMQLLAREVDHRANNLLATIQAIVRLTRAQTVSDFRRELEGRIGAVAKAHKLIAENQWGDTDFGRLVSGELDVYGAGENGRVQLKGESVAIPPRLGQSLALVLHELSTNSAKYGALSVPSGTLSVQWARSGARVEVIWTETGGPQVKAPASRGFGTGLIEAVVRGDFSGDLKFDWRPEGLLCTFSLQLQKQD